MALSLCNTKTNEQNKELAEHGSAFFPIACYHDDLVKESVPWHWHDEMEAVIVSKGSAVIAVGTEKYTVTQGDGFFINAGVLHAAWNKDSSSCRLHSLVFHPRLVGGSIDSVFWQNFIHPILTNAMLKYTYLDHLNTLHQEMLQSIEDTWQSCVAEYAGYEFQVRASLSHLIFLLSDFHPAMAECPSDKALRNNERMKTMLNFIQVHYNEALSISMIAGCAMISESECLRCFRSTIGTPPIQYLKQLRVEKAAKLLVLTDKKIVYISSECGFQDTSYFAKSFRELKGCTPSEYRKRL